MANNIFLNHSLEEYNKRYRNCKNKLLKRSKKEVEEYNINNPNNKDGLLEGHSWWLIEDYYYEIPKAPTWTWFRNLDNIIQISTCVIIVGVIALAIGVPVAVISKNKSPELYVKGPSYAYVNEDINVNNIEVYEKVNNNLVKLESSEYSISPTKFDKKVDGINMVTVTSKKGNKNQFPVKILNSYEINEDAFIDSFKELGYGNKVLEYENTKDKWEIKHGAENTSKTTIKGKVTKFNDNELDEQYVYSCKKMGTKERSSEKYFGNGYKSIYDSNIKENRLYSCPATFTPDMEKKTGKFEYVMDYELPSSKKTGYIVSDSYIQYLINSEDIHNHFIDYKLKDDKTYEYNYNYEIQSTNFHKTNILTFENGKIQKINIKSDYKYETECQNIECNYVIKRVDTTDPFTSIKKLNFLYVASDLEGNKFEKTVKENDTGFSFNLKFFEDYDSSKEQYSKEVNEGFFIDLLANDYLSIINPTNVEVTLDTSSKHKFNVVPTTEGKFSKENEYSFAIAINNEKTKDASFSDNNTFLKYLNDGLFTSGMLFTINVTE